MLCSKCNTALSIFEQNENIMPAMYEYIKHWNNIKMSISETIDGAWRESKMKRIRERRAGTLVD